jgi:hypothetical protein
MRRSNHCYDGGWALWIALLWISQDRRNSRRQIPDRQELGRGWKGNVYGATHLGTTHVVAGETGDNSPQTRKVLHEFLSDSTITALYGFSGGGYNVYHILKRLTQEQRGRLELVVVIGVDSDKLSDHALNSNAFNAHWELVYRNDPPPPLTHIDGPRVLLSGLR